MEMKDKRGKVDLIAVLLIVTVSFSVLTTVLILGDIRAMQIFNLEGISGFAAVTSGKINVTISQDINYTLTTYNMSFGAGKVASGQAWATINSTRAANYFNTAMLAGMNWTNSTEYFPDSLAFRNDGNCNINLSFTSSSTSATFLGGTAPKFEYNSSNAEGSSCASGIASFTEVASNVIPYVLCTNFTAIKTKDTMYMDVRLTIPYDAVGDKLANLTFSANKV